MSEEEAGACAVCFGDHSGAVEPAPCCAARYHPECVQEWAQHQLAQGLPATCPTCRHLLESKAAGAARGRRSPIAGRCMHACWVGGFLVFFCLVGHLFLGAVVGWWVLS